MTRNWCMLLLVIITLILAITHKSLEYKELLLEDSRLCSPITKRKIKLGQGGTSALLVTQSRLNIHSIPWNVDSYCKFEVQSSYSKGGVAAVIQKLRMRRNTTTGQCIDFVQFRTRDYLLSPKYCGDIDTALSSRDVFDEQEYLPFSLSNSFIDGHGEMNAEIFVSKTPLIGDYKRMELVIAFTSYKDCSRHSHHPKNEDEDLQPCSERDPKICIHKEFFNDKIVNCPYLGCLDESGCIEGDVKTPDPKISVGNKVLIGSLSTLCILFAMFILCMWAFKQHKMFCWAPQYARSPTSTERHQPADPVIIGQIEPLSTGHSTATAPPEIPVPDIRDLPPSYDSLFPNQK